MAQSITRPWSPWEARAAWTQFVDTGRPPTDIDRAIARSWERCWGRLNPWAKPTYVRASPGVFERMMQRASSLIDLARPIIEDVAQAVEGSGYAVLLANAARCILMVIGDDMGMAYLASKGVNPGTYLAEYMVGTMAVSLALHDSMPIQVSGAQHYLAWWHDTTGAAAPIYSVSGEPVGVVAMMAHIDRYQHHAVGIVAAASRAIESELRFEWLLQDSHRHLTALNATLDAIGDGILAWDVEGRITHLNRQAASLLDIDPVKAVGRPINQHVKLPPVVEEAVSSGRGLQDAEVTFYDAQGQRRTSCFLSLRIVYGEGTKPTGFIMSLRPAQHMRRLVQRIVGSHGLSTVDEIVGTSAATRHLRRQVLAASRGRAPVLIVGEPGVGKNFIARCIHNGSQRSLGPFIAVNCMTIPRNLAARELLGWEDASGSGQPSKFELADGGTLYLDEIDALPLELQAALMQVIRTGELMRLGGRGIVQVSVRIIASCTPDIHIKAKEGTILPELYHTLQPFMIHVPSLRERREDITPLTEDILRRLSASTGKHLRPTQAFIELLSHYPWPGNVRELELVLERAAAMTETGHLDVDALPDTIRSPRPIALREGKAEPVITLREAEEEAILRAAWATGGRITHMAAVLGIGRTTLWRKLKSLGIDPKVHRTTKEGP